MTSKELWAKARALRAREIELDRMGDRYPEMLACAKEAKATETAALAKEAEEENAKPSSH